MTAPDRRSSPAFPLVVEVETSPGSGVFVADERLRADEIELASDGDVGSATVSVRLDNDFGASAARDKYLPDRRLLIRTDHPDLTQRELLFDGIPSIQDAKHNGGPRGATETYVFQVCGACEVLSQDRRAWVYGRQMRNGEIEDGLSADPTTWQSRSVRVAAMPCVFNLDGEPNCSPTPLTVTAPDGSARTVHIFTYEGEAEAIRWTYLNALRYLVWFHRPLEGPVEEGNIFSATDVHVDFDVDDPKASLPDSGLLRSLLTAPDELNCQAVNLVEALALLADASGVHVTPTPSNAEGKLRTELKVWSSADASPRPIALAWGGRHDDGTPRYDADSASAVDVFAANELHDALIRWDHSRIVNAPIVIGDVRKYEMTVPLVPGWVPTQNLDNVASPDRAAAKALVLTPDAVDALGDDAENYQWYRRYHKNGSEFASYRDVSRTWVLNEDGRFDGATYNRNAPFDDYQPFDFSTVADDTVTTFGAWARRMRPLQKTITKTTDGEGFGVYVQVSFDSGSTWSEPQGSVEVLTDPTGIYFAVTNPSSITLPDVEPETQNMWYAIIDQTFRVRVTAVFDADERLLVRRAPDDANTPTLRTTSRIVYRPTTYKFSSRKGTTNVLAGVNPNATDIGRDDSTAVAAAAEHIARQEQDGQVLATPAIPWADTAFPIGTRITGVGGRGVTFGSRVARETSGPVVVGKRYRLSGGRYETVLILEHD